MRRSDPPDRGFRRHVDGWAAGWLEGWQVGLVAVVIAAIGAVLLVPFAAAPTYLPVPDVDRNEQQLARERDRFLAAATAQTGLPFDVRVVGERMRRFGAAAAAGSSESAAIELEELRSAFARARASAGDDPLVALRAVQTEAFIRTLRRYEQTAEEEPELRELAADLLRTARTNGWVEGRRLILTDAERRTLFRVRWADLVGALDAPPFAPSLNEWRAYYRFLLEHPEPPSADAPREHAGLGAPRWGYVAGLGRRDPTYPTRFAEGVLLQWAGQPEVAAAAFQAHLDLGQEARLATWAQSHLAAALAGQPVAAGEP